MNIFKKHKFSKIGLILIVILPMFITSYNIINRINNITKKNDINNSYIKNKSNEKQPDKLLENNEKHVVSEGIPIKEIKDFYTNQSNKLTLQFKKDTYEYLNQEYKNVCGRANISKNNTILVINQIPINIASYEILMNVKDEDGNWIEGSQINLFNYKDNYKVLTDKIGQAKIKNLSRGIYFYEIIKPGYKTIVGMVFLLNKSKNIDIVLHRCIVKENKVLITIKNKYDQKICGSNIKIYNKDTKIAEGETNGNGQYNIHLSNGNYEYEVTKSGYETLTGNFIVNNEDIEITLIQNEIKNTSNGIYYGSNTEHSFPEKRNIIVKVKGDDGEKLENVKVTISRDGNISRIINTDANGEGIAAGLEKGVYLYKTDKSEYEEASGQVTINDKDEILEITLKKVVPLPPPPPEKHNIIVKVRGDNGEKLENVKVTISRDGNISRIINTDANGEGIAADLEKGVYLYKTDKSGYEEASGQVTINDKDETLEITLKKVVPLPPPPPEKHNIIVKVKGDDGEKLENVKVTISRDGNILRIINTDADGEGIAADLEKGVYLYKTDKSGYEEASGQVTINDKDETLETTLKKLGIKPEKPSNLQVVLRRHNSIKLSWEPANGAATYKLMRDGKLIYEGAELSYFDEGLNEGTEYTYSLIACNDAGSSEEVIRKVSTLTYKDIYFVVAIYLHGKDIDATQISEMDSLRSQLASIDSNLKVTWVMDNTFVFWESNRPQLKHVLEMVDQYGDEVGILCNGFLNNYEQDFNDPDSKVNEWLYMYRYNALNDLHQGGTSGDPSVINSIPDKYKPKSVIDFSINQEQVNWFREKWGIDSFMGWAATQYNAGELTGEGSPLMPYWSHKNNPMIPSQNMSTTSGAVFLNIYTIDPIGCTYTDGQSRWTIAPGDPYDSNESGKVQQNIVEQYINNPYRDYNTMNYLSIMIDANEICRKQNLNAIWNKTIDKLKDFSDVKIVGVDEFSERFKTKVEPDNTNNEFTLLFRGVDFEVQWDGKDYLTDNKTQYLWTETKEQRIILKKHDDDSEWSVIDFTDYTKPISPLPYTKNGKDEDISYVTGRNFKINQLAPLTDYEKYKIKERLAEIDFLEPVNLN